VIEIDRPRDVDPVRDRVVLHSVEMIGLATEVEKFLEVVSRLLEHYPTDDRETVFARDRGE
jgi:hypothetical protein